MLQKIGKWLVYVLVWFLPWSVLFSVVFSVKLDIDFLRYIKELCILWIVSVGAAYAWKNKKKISLDRLDVIVLLYILALIIISVLQWVSLKGIAIWLRYNTLFLCVFLILRYLAPWWGIRYAQLGRIFIFSGGLMLLFSLVIRYVFWEMILTFFWFSGQVSVWDVSGAPPIFHGIPGASVVRFQGLLEWPNQMAYFLLIYLGVFMSVCMQYKKYRMINTLIVMWLILLMIITYSRSVLLGLVWGICMLGVLYIWKILKKNRSTKFYKIQWKKWGVITLIVVCIGIVLAMQFGHKFAEIVMRKGSTSAHYERMVIGLYRFIDAPLWQGLWQAWPTSRHIYSVDHSPMDREKLNASLLEVEKKFQKNNPDFVFSSEHYYIPESWFIQQLIESGIIGTLLFINFFIILWIAIRKYRYLWAMLIWVCIMNCFLHSFESTHSSLVLFILLGTLVSKDI